ncbi:hypothetical protein Dimus_029326, partial [Dionaea muscipula]
MENEVNEEEVTNEEMNEGQNQEEDFEWIQVEEETQIEGEPTEKEVVNEDSGSGENLYDEVGEERTADEDGVALDAVVPAPAVQTTPAQTSVQPEGKTNATGVDLLTERD